MRVAFRSTLLSVLVAVAASGCTSGAGAGTRAARGSNSAVPPAAGDSTLVSSPTSSTAGTATAGRPVPAALLTSYRAGGSFFSNVLHHDGSTDVELDSAANGLPLLSVLPSRRGRVIVVSVATMGATRLMVTYGTGENCSNGLADCGPLPNVCGGEVDVLDLPTGTMTPVWSFPRSVHGRRARNRGKRP